MLTQSPAPAAEPAVKPSPATDDGVKWLALLLRDSVLMLVRGVEARYGIKANARPAREQCPRCGLRK